MTPGPVPAPARAAASGVIVRHDGGLARVLMGQRQPGARFMADRFVFPGGAVDPGDHTLGRTPLPPRCATRLSWRAEGVTAEALAWALTREILEETGLVVRPHTDGPITSINHAPSWAAMTKAGYRPASDRFRFIFRAITPPSRPIRFDARFFLISAEDISGSLDQLAGCGELSDLKWLTFDEARQENLPSITHRVLDEVQSHVEQPDSERPVPFFYQDESGRRTVDQVG